MISRSCCCERSLRAPGTSPTRRDPAESACGLEPVAVGVTVEVIARPDAQVARAEIDAEGADLRAAPAAASRRHALPRRDRCAGQHAESRQQRPRAHHVLTVAHCFASFSDARRANANSSQPAIQHEPAHGRQQRRARAARRGRARRDCRRTARRRRAAARRRARSAARRACAARARRRAVRAPGRTDSAPRSPTAAAARAQAAPRSACAPKAPHTRGERQQHARGGERRGCYSPVAEERLDQIDRQREDHRSACFSWEMSASVCR